MHSKLLRVFQIMSLGISASVPFFAVRFVNQEAGLFSGALALGMFSVLLVWQIVFVLYEQILFPESLARAALYTGTSVLQLAGAAWFSHLLFSSYVYFLASLACLALLLFLGAGYVAYSKKQGVAKGWLALFLFVLAGVGLWFSFVIAEPFLAQASALTNSAQVVFVGVFGAQVLKMLFTQAKFFTQSEEAVSAHAPAHVLPKGLTLVVMLLSIFATGFALF